jgi:hypothetical protein
MTTIIKRDTNQTNYHFKLTKFEPGSISVKYYMTAKQLGKDFNCSTVTIYHKIRGTRNVKALAGYKVENAIYPVVLVNKMMQL